MSLAKKASSLEREPHLAAVVTTASPPDRIAPVDGEHKPSGSSAQLIRWMGITDANSAGNVHGGRIMKLCDEAAGLAAIKHAGERVVTAGMDRMNFLFPIYVGDLVTFSATVNAAWRTSMEVGVRVDAENPRTGEVRHTNTAYLTMVALDGGGRPTAVPSVVPTSATEERRMREAELRRANRLAEREQILANRAPEESARSH
jgi:acyl-CoA hydrolase